MVVHPHDPFATSSKADMAYAENVKEAKSVWFSGYLTGSSYVPAPIKESIEEQFDDAQLSQVSYSVPRGYMYRKHELPTILEDSPSTGTPLQLGLKIYTTLMGLSFVFFLIAACPIPWGTEKDSSTRKIKWTVWNITDEAGNATEGTLSTVPVIKQYLRCAAGCTVVATIFSFFGAVGGLLKWFKGPSFISYYLLLVLSLFSLLWGICGNGVMIRFYSADLVGITLKDYSSLSGGFALSLLGWIAALGALGVLIFFTQLNVGPSLKSIRTFDTAYFVLIFIALVLTTVGTTQPMFQRHFSESIASADSVAAVDWVRVGYWREEVSGEFLAGSVLTEDATTVTLIMGPEAYRCPKYRSVLDAGVSFLILGSITLFCASVMSILAFLKPGFRAASCVLAGIAAVFLTVNWIIVIVLLKSSFCTNPVEGSVFASYPGAPSGLSEGLLEFPKYQMAGGFALPFTAWCITLLAVIGNAKIPWPRSNKRMIFKQD